MQYELASYITGEDELSVEAHILVGYADVELLGDRLALVKTILAPGYFNTPEATYIKANMKGSSNDEIRAVTGELLTMQGVCERGGRDVLRELHENGYPQVKEMEDTVDFFPDKLAQEEKSNRRRAEMQDKVFDAILAQRGVRTR